MRLQFFKQYNERRSGSRAAKPLKIALAIFHKHLPPPALKFCERSEQNLRSTRFIFHFRDLKKSIHNFIHYYDRFI